jgi:rubredoxin
MKSTTGPHDMIAHKKGGESNEGDAHRKFHERFPREASELRSPELDESRPSEAEVQVQRPEVTCQAEPLEHKMECVNCGFEFDPIKYRWLCPHCKFKNSCCEGAPLHAGEEQCTDG